MDPNLVQLAAAYREAKAQLGDDAVLSDDGRSEDDEDAGARTGSGDLSVAEDAHEGLNASVKPLAHGAASLPGAHQAALTAEPRAEADPEPPPAATRRMNGHSNRPPAPSQRGTATRAAVGPSFSAADAFDGARPGFVFRVGSNGTGYYRDAASSVSALKSRRKADRSGDGVGGVQDGAHTAINSGAAAAGAHGSADWQGRSVPRTAGDDTDSENDRDRRGNRGGKQARGDQRGGRKSLPGRLRKKLARDREIRGR